MLAPYLSCEKSVFFSEATARIQNRVTRKIEYMGLPSNKL